MARLSRLEEDREFDLEFWAKVGAEGRFEAAWEMISEIDKMKGKKNAGQPRLQRSVASLKQRGS